MCITAAITAVSAHEQASRSTSHGRAALSGPAADILERCRPHTRLGWISLRHRDGLRDRLRGGRRGAGGHRRGAGRGDSDRGRLDPGAGPPPAD